MHKITQIQICGFKRLRNISLEMRPIMAMIGANGVGKTSLLDAISLLSASANGLLSRTLSDLGGCNEVITRGKEESITFSASMDTGSIEPLRYTLSLIPEGQAYKVTDERLSQQRLNFDSPFKHLEVHHGKAFYFDKDINGLVQPDWDYDHYESALSQVPKMFQKPEEFRRTISAVTKYHVLDVSKRAPVKLPQQLKPASLPGADGEDLTPFLFNLRESHRDRFEAIEDTLRVAFPGFEYLGFPSPATGMLSLTWKERSFKDPLYMHQLSEGTLRFLWLISLLQSPGLSTVTMIDEPEVSLHPELLSFLADLFREASNRTQIIVATHSDRLISFLEPKEVVVMDIDDEGYTNAQWADELDLDAWLADYSLDELWRMGRMGGRS